MISRQQLAEMAAILSGIPVLGCRCGSPAAEAGVGYGDVVLAINGVPTPGLAEFLAARRLRSDGYNVRLFSNGSEREVFIPFRPPANPMDALALQLAPDRSVTQPS
jgi:S1-C subfamily serine protease